MKQYRELRGHTLPLLSMLTHSSSQTLRLSDCCLPGLLFTLHIDLYLVAHSTVYYQPSQTGLNLLFPLTHANRGPLLSKRLPRLPQMTRQFGRLLADCPAGRPAYSSEAKLLWADLGLLCVWGDLKVFITVAKDYSSMPRYADVRFGDFVMQHRCNVAQTNI